MSATSDGRLDRGTKVALVAMCLGIFLIANDFTALAVAVPNIESDLNTTLGHAQWVINAYALVFGVLIVTGGRLADLFGRKRAFMIGAAIFAVFSLLSGLAPSIGLLIVGRALMGIGGALMWPAVLGMVYSLLPDEKAGLAGGLILGVAGLGNAVGPLLGGVLTQELNWRWVFFVNVPVAIFAMVVTQAKVAESKADDGGDRRIDYPGIAILSIAAVSILVALDEGPSEGFGDPIILGLFGLAIVLIGVWVGVERRQGEAALVPSSVLRNRLFTACAVTVLLMSAIFFAALLYLPQYFEKILGYSALEGRRRAAPDDGRVRRGVVRRRAPLRPARGPPRGRDGGERAGCGHVRARPARHRFQLLGAGARDGGARLRRRALLLGDHHDRGDRARCIEVEPRGRDHLHVPDRRRCDRPRPQHRDRRRRPARSWRASRWPSPSTGCWPCSGS